MKAQRPAARKCKGADLGKKKFMREEKAASGKNGAGWLWAGVGVAVAIAAGSYLVVQERAAPTQGELISLLPQDDGVTTTELPAQNEASADPVEEGGDAPAEAIETVEEAPSADVDETVTVDGDSELSDTADDNAVAESEETKPDEEPSAVADNTELPEAESAGDTSDASPSIDEVRLAADGVAVIAGRAVPGAMVDVLVDGEIVTSARADAGGSFAAVGIVEAGANPRVLSLRSQSGERVVDSVDQVIIAPVVDDTSQLTTTDVAEKAEGGAPTERALAETQSDTAQDEGVPDVEEPLETLEQPVKTTDVDIPSPSARADTSAVADASTEEIIKEKDPSTETSQVAAPGPVVAPDAPETPEITDTDEVSDPPQIALLKSDEEGVTLLQTSPGPPARVKLDTIGYTDSGIVQLSGRANREAKEVRVYLNNRLATALLVVDTGQWRGEIPDVKVGVYTLRLDAVDAQGVVTSRLETPFKREAPEVLAAAAADASGPVAAITVQRGDTLWAIARDRYGEGLSYVQVYNANRDAIRDPDLIYPGQIFTLPAD